MPTFDVTQNPFLSSHIFGTRRECIQKQLRGKTIILVTNQLHLMPEVDGIVVMKNNRIHEQGSFAELINKTEGEFRRLYEDLAQKSDDKNVGGPLQEESKVHETVSTVTTLPPLKSTTLKPSSSSLTPPPAIGKLVRAGSMVAGAPKVSDSKPDKEKAGGSKAKLELKRSMAEDKEEQLKKDAGKLVMNEGRTIGNVQWKVYSGYAAAVGWWTFAFMLIFFVAGNGFQIMSSFWLSIWSESAESSSPKPVSYYIAVYVALSMVR